MPLIQKTIALIGRDITFSIVFEMYSDSRAAWIVRLRYRDSGIIE